MAFHVSFRIQIIFLLNLQKKKNRVDLNGAVRVCSFLECGGTEWNGSIPPEWNGSILVFSYDHKL